MANSRRDFLNWYRDGEAHALRYGQRTTPVLHVVKDETYPTMWRIRLPDGSLSDMVNLTRAKDAARDIAVGIILRQPKHTAQRPQEPSGIRQTGEAATTLANTPADESLTPLTAVSSTA